MDYNNRIDFLKKNECRRDLIVFLFSLFVAFLGSYKAISSVYMPDDFLLASSRMPISFYLNQGRFVQAIVTWWLNNTNVNIISTSSIFTPLFIILTALMSSLFVINIASKKMSILSSCLISGLICCHPVYSMMSVYHLSTIMFSISTAFFCLYMIVFELYIAKRELKLFLLLAGIVIFICGTYQPFFISVLIYSVLSAINNKEFKVNLKGFSYLTPSLSGVLIYAVIFKITKSIAGVNNWDDRGSLVDNIPHRIIEVFNFYPSLFYKSWWLISWQFNLFLSMAIIVSILFFVFKDRPYRIPLRAFVLASLFILPILPISILRDFDTSPRSMVSISISYAASILLFTSFDLGRVRKSIIFIAICLGLISSNSYLYTMERQQVSDKFIINSISSKLVDIDTKGKEILFSNNGRIELPFWAINGAFYFYTGNNYNITQAGVGEEKECSGSEGDISIIQSNNKIIICTK